MTVSAGSNNACFSVTSLLLSLSSTISTAKPYPAATMCACAPCMLSTSLGMVLDLGLLHFGSPYASSPYVGLGPHVITASSAITKELLFPQLKLRMDQPFKSCRGLGYMVASPDAFVRPQKNIWPPAERAYEHVAPAVIILAPMRGLRLLLTLNTSSSSGDIRSFWELCPSRPYPAKPQVKTAPSEVMATVWLLPQTTSTTFGDSLRGTPSNFTTLGTVS
mmetsp:Transcript_10470/g.19892  ORF Transcript_10470/g.19892 Transcript_10470/m.19892 type:complete len:220 (+) Transcript_10470:413-1072(+)